ncbi:MAG TPA: DUF1015 domain-containing protein [Actinomycetota bacterium]
MPRISPFHGLVFDTAIAGPLDQVTAPPYDVISDRRRLDHLRTSPYSVVHLDLAEGVDDPSAGPHSRYARAAHLLDDWRLRGILTLSPEPCYYAYEMTFAIDGRDHAIRGLLCAMDLEPWNGSVVPHERVMDGPVQDRLQLLRATHTHMSPVYGTITGPCQPLSTLLQTVSSAPATSTTQDDQGVIHRMWPIAADAAIATWVAGDSLLIADGHHRYTTALHYRDERRRGEGPGPWDRVLTLVVDAAAERLPVLPFHRVQVAGSMPDITGDQVGDLAEALANCSDHDVVAATVRRKPDGSIRFDTLPLPGRAPAVQSLHADILDGRIPDVALRFVSDPEEAVEAVRSGEAVGAYLLPPTTPDRIRTVIDRGERLPQKSTYFWPKPRTGMVMMPLDVPADRSVVPAS